ncbi:MAG: ABC transporter substrate-binding protein [Firmicutes bacterium]|nr:ABC transporter substrate-binding protein [Bacillota bacterium]
MKKALAATLVTLISGAALAACGSSNASPPAQASGAAPSKATQASTPTHLVFNPDGTPNLKGLTIKMGMAAGNAHVGDTTIYVLTQYLKKWGANVTFTLGNSNTTALATVAGRLQVDDGTLPQLVDAGAVLIGPAMEHVDYILVGNNITSIQQLKGKSIGVAISTSPDDVLLTPLLQQAGLTPDQVHVVFTQSSSNTVNAMLTGRLDAGFVHADAWLKLQQDKNLHILITGSKLAPWMADSFIGANANWLKSNPALAEAVDLAWLHAARLFNTNTQAWVNYAEEYTHNADPPATVKAIHDALATANPWPSDGGGFTTAIVQQNYNEDKKLGAIKGLGLRPISDWLDTTPWKAAVKVFQSGSGS